MKTLKLTTTDVTPSELTTDGMPGRLSNLGVAVEGLRPGKTKLDLCTNRILLPNNSAFSFRAVISSQDMEDLSIESHRIEGTITRGADASSTAFVGMPTVQKDPSNPTRTVTYAADAGWGGLQFVVTGNGHTVRWTGTVELTRI